MTSRLFSWATCSSLALLATATAATGQDPAGEREPFLTKEEALALAFEGCVVERRTEALDAAQRKRVAELADEEFGRATLFAYEATKDGKLVGTAYFDVHRVRTLRETIMVVVAPDERVARIEVLAFAEPQEYLPRAKWYAQFVGKRLDPSLSLKGSIRGVTGATLTAGATTSAVRVVLAQHRVRLEAAEAAEEEEEKDEDGGRDRRRERESG